jgi:hypothetical protein
MNLEDIQNEKTRKIMQYFCEKWKEFKGVNYNIIDKQIKMIETLNDPLEAIIKHIDMKFKGVGPKKYGIDAGIPGFVNNYFEFVDNPIISQTLIDNSEYKINIRVLRKKTLGHHKATLKTAEEHYKEWDFRNNWSDKLKRKLEPGELRYYNPEINILPPAIYPSKQEFIDYAKIPNEIQLKYENEFQNLFEWLDHMPTLKHAEKSIIEHAFPLVLFIKKRHIIKYFKKMLEFIESGNFNKNILSYENQDYESLCFKSRGEEYANITNEVKNCSALIFENLEKIGEKTNEALNYRLENNHVCVISCEAINIFNNALLEQISKNLIIQ